MHDARSNLESLENLAEKLDAPQAVKESIGAVREHFDALCHRETQHLRECTAIAARQLCEQMPDAVTLQMFSQVSQWLGSAELSIDPALASRRDDRDHD